MVYKVLDVFAVGENTSVTVAGNGQGLRNGITIFTPGGESFELLSVGLTAAGSAEEMTKSTMILVQGEFKAETFTV